MFPFSSIVHFDDNSLMSSSESFSPIDFKL